MFRVVTLSDKSFVFVFFFLSTFKMLERPKQTNLLPKIKKLKNAVVADGLTFYGGLRTLNSLQYHPPTVYTFLYRDNYRLLDIGLKSSASTKKDYQIMI